VVFMEKIILLLLSLLGIIIITPIPFIYILKTYKHKCRIFYKRADKVEMVTKRFRIYKNKQGDSFIRTLGSKKKRIEIEKPTDDFFYIIGKKKYAIDIVIGEDGEPYCIKPSFDKLGKLIDYKLSNRNVLGALRQEIKNDILMYNWKNNFMQVLNFLFVFLIIVSVILGLYFNNKIVNKSIEANKIVSSNIKEGMVIIGEAIGNLTDYYERMNGSINNPLPYPQFKGG